MREARTKGEKQSSIFGPLDWPSSGEDEKSEGGKP